MSDPRRPAGQGSMRSRARYDDLLRPVADGPPAGFCKLIADRRSPAIRGAPVLTEYSAETVQTVAACMAAQKVCRAIGVERFPQVWSYLGAEE